MTATTGGDQGDDLRPQTPAVQISIGRLATANLTARPDGFGSARADLVGVEERAR